ncbi:MAG: hypothetical protein AAB537_02445 [Patescibacteria group bacterium]
MPKSKKILMLGIWLILIPFLGVPTTWRTFLLYLTGFILIADYFLRKKVAAPTSPTGGPVETGNENDQQ